MYKNKYLKYKDKYMNTLKNQDGGADILPTYDKNILNIISFFFEHKIKIKMLHFQTKNYGTHKALDAYLTEFNNKFDRFMEVAQGNVNKLTNTNIKIDVKMLSDDTIIDYLSYFITHLNTIDSLTSHNGLRAIRDELVADADQLKYLLTFN